MGQRQKKQGSRRVRAVALVFLLFATKLYAQLPDLRIGQEIRIHTDSTKKTASVGGSIVGAITGFGLLLGAFAAAYAD